MYYIKKKGKNKSVTYVQEGIEKSNHKSAGVEHAPSGLTSLNPLPVGSITLAPVCSAAETLTKGVAAQNLWVVWISLMPDLLACVSQ